jgi:hypothetical protein
MLKMPQIIWPEEARLSYASTKGVKRGGDDMRSHLFRRSFPSLAPPIHSLPASHDGMEDIFLLISVHNLLLYIRAASAPALVR